MTRQPAEPLRLDYLIRAGAVHSMSGPTYRSVGLSGRRIVAVSAESDGLDDLAGRDTTIVDSDDLTLLPAFADSHEHLMEASRNTLKVPVDRGEVRRGIHRPRPRGRPSRCAWRVGSDLDRLA